MSAHDDGSVAPSPVPADEAGADGSPEAAAAAMRSPGAPGEARPARWWRNPWAIGLLSGLAFVTIMTPRTRYVPDPPRVVAQLPAGVWLDGVGEAAVPWADGVTVLGFVGARPEGCPDPVPLLRKLQIAFAQASLPLRVTTAVVASPGEGAAKAIARARHVEGGARTGWDHVVLEDPDALSVLLIGGGADVGSCDVGGLSRVLTIVDERGGARGVYPVLGPEVLSEVYHRTQHVWQSVGDAGPESSE